MELRRLVHHGCISRPIPPQLCLALLGKVARRAGWGVARPTHDRNTSRRRREAFESSENRSGEPAPRRCPHVPEMRTVKIETMAARLSRAKLQHRPQPKHHPDERDESSAQHLAVTLKRFE